MLFGLSLNAERVELRKTGRVVVGIQEAFAEHRSLDYLMALTTDPLEATATYELQVAEAESNKISRSFEFSQGP